MFPSTLQRLARTAVPVVQVRADISKQATWAVSRSRERGTASSPANYCKPAGHVCCARVRPRWTRPGLFRGWPRRRPRGQTEAALTTQQMYPGDTWAEFAELQSFPVKSSAHLSWLVYNGVSKPPLCEVAQADAECWTRSHPPSLPSYVLLSLLLGSLA